MQFKKRDNILIPGQDREYLNTEYIIDVLLFGRPVGKIFVTPQGVAWVKLNLITIRAFATIPEAKEYFIALHDYRSEFESFYKKVDAAYEFDKRYWAFFKRIGDGRKNGTAEQNDADVAEQLVTKGYARRHEIYSHSIFITEKGQNFLDSVRGNMRR